MNLGPKSHYWKNTYYRTLVEQRIDKLDAPDKRKEEILTAAPRLKRLDKISKFAKKIWVIPIIISILFIIAEISFAFLYFIFGIVLSLALYNIYRHLQEYVEKHERNLLLVHQEELGILAKEASKANAVIIEAWESYNESFKGYPPDWDERRYLVKKRDNWSCTKCSWPHGFKRLARNLHVHHNIPISKGGNNALSNLITLCHVCHRKESGDGHNKITYRPKHK
jgi:hypothetical protein